MVQWMALAMPLYALTNLYASAQLASGKATVASARASAQSIGLIVGALLTWRSGDPLYIAQGFVAAYLFLTLWGFRDAWLRGLRPWPAAGEWREAYPAIMAIWRAIKVLLLVPVLMQLHFIVERRVASLVSGEAVAALDYARFISDTAVLLLAMPLGLAGLGAMPAMSEREFHAAARRSLRMLLYVSVPLSVLLCVHVDPIVRIVLERGAFDARSVLVTTTILQPLAAGLWALLLGYAGAKFMNARGRNWHLIAIYATGLGCNILLNLSLYRDLGSAALGIGAAAYGLVFGMGVLASLGMFRPLARDISIMAVLALVYAALWSLVPTHWETSPWAAPMAFVIYWGGAALLVPRCREVLHDAWLILRTA